MRNEFECLAKYLRLSIIYSHLEARIVYNYVNGTGGRSEHGGNQGRSVVPEKIIGSVLHNGRKNVHAAVRVGRPYGEVHLVAPKRRKQGHLRKM